MERAYQMLPRKMTRSSECVSLKKSVCTPPRIYGEQGSIEHLLHARQDSGCWGWNSQRDTVAGSLPQGSLLSMGKEAASKNPQGITKHNQSVVSPQGQTQHWKRKCKLKHSEAATIPPMGRTLSLAG